MYNKIPLFLRRCFWSYRLSALDLKEDKELVITQVLNWADLKGVRWLFKTYAKRDILKVLRHPRRGVWLKDVLNFWTTIFKVHLPYDSRVLAIREIDPAKVDQKALARFFRKVAKKKTKK